MPLVAGKKRRKSPAGISTNELILAAHVGNNSELFPQILSLYVPAGSRIADVTYGKGVFWKDVAQRKYELHATDLSMGIDCRDLPYDDASMDCVVLDPPYMHTPGGTAHTNHQNYEGYYKNNGTNNGTGEKYHEAVLALYFAAAREARRVLKNGGTFIVKCADEVCANRQRLTHVELINEFAQMDFVVEDLFVLVRNNKPGVSRVLRQIHARKNHSYFLIFRRKATARSMRLFPQRDQITRWRLS
jgi:DNA modification methylase